MEQKIVDRFFSKVLLPKSLNSCWLWGGTKLSKRSPYGRFLLNGKRIQAHRVSWLIHREAIPTGLLICHSCDNPPCVNPWHLFEGTSKVNLADMITKGRANFQQSGGVDHRLSVSVNSKTADRHSAYPGVSWSKAAGKWHARITKNGVRLHLGLFDNEQQAAIAYRDVLDSLSSGNERNE